MRAGVAFLLSFVIAVTIGSLILPDNTPKIRQKPLAGSVPLPPSFDFLPGLPSLIVPRLDDASKRYEQAWQLLKAGKYGAAESVYLQILIRNPQDQKAMQGLVMLQRLLANQDPEKLLEQAEAYRGAIAKGQTTDEQYSPRELELLAGASLTGANEIVSEQNVKVTIVTGVVHSTPTAPSHVNLVRDPMGAIKQRVSQLATSLGSTLAKTDVATGEKPKPAADKENVTVVSALDSHQPAPSIAQTPALSSPSNANRSGAASGTVLDPVIQHSQGATIHSAPVGTTQGDTPGVTNVSVDNPKQRTSRWRSWSRGFRERWFWDSFFRSEKER
jgi:hypothetical protein